MKQNILVVSYNYKLSQKIAKNLAEIFSMRYFDQLELFEFDHIPRRFEDVLSENGEDYVLKKLRSITKMQLDFSDSVYCCDMSFVSNCDDLFYKINLNNFVVFLKKDNTITELQDLETIEYKTNLAKQFFIKNEQTLRNRKKQVAENLADIIVDVTNLSEEEITDRIVDDIKNYYYVK